MTKDFIPPSYEQCETAISDMEEHIDQGLNAFKEYLHNSNSGSVEALGTLLNSLNPEKRQEWMEKLAIMESWEKLPKIDQPSDEKQKKL